MIGTSKMTNKKVRDTKTERFLVELSGDFPEFGLVELQSILEAYNYTYSYTWLDTEKRVLLLETNPIGAWIVSWRSAYVKNISQVLAPSTDSNFDEVISSLREKYRIYLTYRLRNKKDKTRILDIYKEILSKLDYSERLPVKKITLIIDKFDATIYLLQKIGGSRDKINARNPKFRSYAPASTMDSFISRALVNFSRTLPGDVFLDPFAGSGSIALEASSIGAFVIASDLSLKHLLGLKLNKKIYGFDIKLMVADATKLPLDTESIDAIATDPPYGRSASTFKRTLKELYSDFMKESSRILKKNKFLVFCSPSFFNAEEELINLGFKLVHKLTMPVHRSLRRNIYISALT